MFTHKGFSRDIVTFAVALLLSSFGHRYGSSAEQCCPYQAHLTPPLHFSPAFVITACYPQLDPPPESHTGKLLHFPSAFCGDSTLHLRMCSVEAWESCPPTPWGNPRPLGSQSLEGPPPVLLVGSFKHFLCSSTKDPSRMELQLPVVVINSRIYPCFEFLSSDSLSLCPTPVLGSFLKTTCSQALSLHFSRGTKTLRIWLHRPQAL